MKAEMSPEEVNKHITKLIATNGEGLSGAELTIYKHFVETNMKMAETDNKLKDVLTQKMLLEGRKAKLEGSLQAHVNLLVHFEVERRSTLRPVRVVPDPEPKPATVEVKP